MTRFLGIFTQEAAVMEIPSPMAIFILLLDMIETCPIAGFWEWEIIWDHFQKPLIDRLESQELGGGAVGGQEVKF